MLDALKPLRALVISYVFPPVGGAGVQRVLKLVKYLPQHGIEPVVLTAESPSVPVADASLLRDVPASTEIVRARTLEPGYAAKRAAWQAQASRPGSSTPSLQRRLVEWGRKLLVPDPQVLWLPAAHWALARRVGSRRPDDVVFISGPPFSQFLLSGMSCWRPGTALVLDYRDEWTMTSTAYEMSGQARVSQHLERAIVQRAHAITTATEEFREALLQRFRFLDPARVHAIPNGYDPDDFPETLPSPPTDHLVLSYTGTVFRLTSAQGLLQALALLHEREPRLAQQLEVRFAGRIVDTESQYFDGSERLGVKRLGYVEHARAVAELAGSHSALCILDDVSGVERIYPAKIFEIMRVGRPCLALTPEGALARLVRRHRLGQVLPPRDIPAIAHHIAEMLRTFRGSGSLTHAPLDIEGFDRRAQAARFADVFREARAYAIKQARLTA
ncbi:MAG TPA: glycosyltransferase [Polyangiaceae bacterium]|nr:glycosyltransferase [Polyangiaceae bacterium]